MKKLTVFLCGLVLILSASVIHATPYTWVDEITWEHSHIAHLGSYGYTHYINPFVPFTDFVSSYNLNVGLYDPSRRHTWVYINQPGLVGDGFYDFTHVNQDFGWSLAGRAQLRNHGRLDVTIRSYGGSVNLGTSTLTANGALNSAQVPEPTTMLLMGAGLLGLVVYGRKKVRGK